jgi:hypothetical protein
VCQPPAASRRTAPVAIVAIMRREKRRQPDGFTKSSCSLAGLSRGNHIAVIAST